MATSELINSREQVDLWGTIESLFCRGMQDPVTLFGTRALVCTSRRDNERQRRHSLIVPRFLSRIEVQGGVKEDNNIELHSGEYFISVHPRLLVHLLSRLFSVARRVSFLYTYTVSFSLSTRSSFRCFVDPSTRSNDSTLGPAPPTEPQSTLDTFSRSRVPPLTYLVGL